MRRGIAVVIAVCFLCGAGLLLPAFGQETTPIKLPQPKFEHNKTLFEALKDRKSSREYKSGNLSQQTLSNLLWAAWGIDRTDSGKRTAPSALNRQEIEVYVATAEGLYRYDPKANTLVPVLSQDIRALTGKQPYVKDGAVNLVYVADFAKMGEDPEAEKMILAAADTGFIGQNVYLYCASEGLGTVFRASIDKPKLAETMKLRPDQRITFAQTVGLLKSEK